MAAIAVRPTIEDATRDKETIRDDTIPDMEHPIGTRQGWAIPLAQPEEHFKNKAEMKAASRL
jgi:hypothetical protein